MYAIASTLASVLLASAGAAFLSLRARKRRAAVCSEALGLAACEARHAQKVRRIAGCLKRRKSSRPVSLLKRAVSHQVPKARDAKYADDKIDVSDLDGILHIDAEARTCLAEPGVAFVDLVRATMRYGLVPIVVPELKTITIGGAVSGCSLESMSFRYGGFHDTCLEYEVITARGDILTCSPEHDSLLFQMMHGSFGTLGILSRLRFRLVPAKPFVKVNYEKYADLGGYQAAILRHSQDAGVDFMDGIIHSPTEYVLSLGRFTDEAPYSNSYDWMKVYYLSTARREEDYLKTPDYFFRYDRGVTNVHPKSALGRFFFGWFLSSSNFLRLAEKLHRLLPQESPDVIVDVFVPFSKMPAFLDWYRAEFRHFPLWCVPYKRVRDYEWIAPRVFAGLKDELFVDLAIYGMKQRDGKNYYKIMEDKLLELGGIKTLISYNYYSEDDFWRSWNKENYYKAKKMTDPDNIFRDIYTKTCRASLGLREARP